MCDDNPTKLFVILWRMVSWCHLCKKRGIELMELSSMVGISITCSQCFPYLEWLGLSTLENQVIFKLKLPHFFFLISKG